MVFVVNSYLFVMFSYFYSFLKVQRIETVWPVVKPVRTRFYIKDFWYFDPFFPAPTEQLKKKGRKVFIDNK